MFKATLFWLGLLAPTQAQFVQQGSKLVGTGASSIAQQGNSVAISADGNTAVVGGRGDGAVWVFTRNGGLWTQQSAKLVGSGTMGLGQSDQGFSVAISADGNTIITGSPVDNGPAGAAWVFTRSGGVWSQQGNKLVGSGASPTAKQGWSVAISGDGNTALIGGISDNNAVGAVWVFTRSGGVWTQQGNKLVGSGGTVLSEQGFSVALSADGNTAIIGGDADNNFAGAIWVFTRSGGLWTQQGPKLVGSGANGNATQGSSVALSADGNTALVGGPTDPGMTGAVWVFTRNGGVWTQQGNKLVGSGGSAFYSVAQGYSVALSADGNTALAGGPHDNNQVGAAWVFKRSVGVWTQYGNKLVGSDANGRSQQGVSVAISAGGSTAIVGGQHDGIAAGAAWVFTVPHVRDFNADARSDALLYDPLTGTAYTALSNGDGTFQYVYNLFTPAFDIVRTGDFNGDGRADLVLYNSHTGLGYIGLGKGDGTFNFQSLFWSPGFTAVETGDLNGDGRTDVILYNSTTGVIDSGLSDGTGGFLYKSVVISPGYAFVRVADFTGDGKADVFLYGPTTGVSSLAVGDGTGGFTLHPLFVSPGYDHVEAGDLNGDGKADVMLYNSRYGYAATGISDGLGGFSFKPLLFTPGFTSVRLADYTGDGKADLTLYNSANGLAYFGTGSGDGTFVFQSLFWSPSYDTVIPQDVNGDGKADVLLYNQLTGTAYTGISNGDGTFTYTYSLWGSGKTVTDK